MKKFNAEYEILREVIIGDVIISLGFCPEAVGCYATWRSKVEEPSVYFLGHYFLTFEDCLVDFYKRSYYLALSLKDYSSWI